MDSRKAAILEEIIRAHIETATPIGSRFLVENASLSVSAATVRNDMMELEDEGFLTHTHTSGGRIPTETAYRYYAAHCLRERPIAKRHADAIADRMTAASSSRQSVKELARAVADHVEGAVLVAFTPDDVYYTGLTHLFAQPEFASPEHIVTMTSVLEHLDAIMEDIAASLTESITIAIGSESPFGDDTAVIFVREATPRGDALFGILGPQRMRYDTILPFARHIQQHFIAHIHADD